MDEQLWADVTEAMRPEAQQIIEQWACLVRKATMQEHFFRNINGDKGKAELYREIKESALENIHLMLRDIH